MLDVTETPSRPDPRPGDILRRLRARPLSSWSAERVAAIRAALQALADLASAAAEEPTRVVPALHPSALADQLEVLLRDAERCGATPADIDRVLGPVAQRLGTG